MTHNDKVHKCSGYTPNQAKQLQNVMLYLFSVLFTNSHCSMCIELLHALSSIPVSKLKPILDDADRRSLRHSDWFKLKMIMAFSFNKLFPRIPQLPPKTQFIKIKFINQGLDLLNISNIFRDHRVASKIPQYFENLDPPLICYQYKKTH